MRSFNIFVCLVGLAVVGVTASAQEQNKREQVIVEIIEVLDKAFAQELPHLRKENLKNIDLKAELASIKPKFAYVVKHELTQAQADFLINYLRDLNVLTATTTRDLLSIAKTELTYARIEASNRAAEKYCPELMQQAKLARCNDESYEDRIAWTKEFEQVDLHDAGFNAHKKFMCQCTYVESITHIECSDAIAEVLYKSKLYTYIIKRINKAIAFPFVLFNGDFFLLQPGWKEQLKKSGAIFAITHDVTGALLEALEAN